MFARNPIGKILHRHRHRLRVAALAAAAATASPPHAMAADEIPDAVSRTLREFTSRGIEVVDTFQAPGDWYGVAAKARGNGLVLYIDESGENLFMGMMIDAKGRANHTETSLKRYFPEQYANLESSIPEPAAPFTAAAHFTASALAGIPAVRYAPFDGDPESTLYVFFDFGCDHCRGLFQTLQADAIREALTQFRTALAVIPVAFSGTETAYKSSYALVKQPPIENLVTLFGHEAPLPSDITEAQIDLGAEQLVAIMGAVKEHKVSAVPRVVYVSANDVVEREGTLGQSELLSLITPPSAP